MGIVVVLVLVEEVATGLYTQGAVSIPTMLGEASRVMVLAGVLWGTGDLAHLLIDVGHDVRASRILVARVAHLAKVPPLGGPSRRADSRVEERFSDRPVPRRDLGFSPAADDEGG